MTLPKALLVASNTVAAPPLSRGSYSSSLKGAGLVHIISNEGQANKIFLIRIEKYIKKVAGLQKKCRLVQINL
jgi:hypothetical protein